MALLWFYGGMNALALGLGEAGKGTLALGLGEAGKGTLALGPGEAKTLNATKETIKV